MRFKVIDDYNKLAQEKKVVKHDLNEHSKRNKETLK